MNENNYMDLAIEHAKKAASQNEVPVGAVLVIEEVCKLKTSRYLVNTAIYVTLEPCVMCAVAISESRIKKIYFGAYDEKKGAIENGIRIFSNKNYFKPEIYGGIRENECSQLLKSFFSKKRKSS